MYTANLKDFDDRNDIRIIRTGLCGEKGLEILESVNGQLSDGIWENIPQMERYWKNEQIAIDHQFDNEVVIVVNTTATTIKSVPYRWNCLFKRMEYKNSIIRNPFCHMTDGDILKWFARKIKKIVSVEQDDNHGDNWWKNCTERELDYIGCTKKITVGDCKTVYKHLLTF